MNAASDNSIVRFATFELDLKEEQLRKSGSLVRLPPQPFKLLATLATQAGRLVTRQELCDQIWGPGPIVDFEQGLNHCIKQVRLALGDDADNPRFIETVPKRGYRFIADIHAYDRVHAAAAPEPDLAGDGSPGAGLGRTRRGRQWVLAAAILSAIALTVAFVATTRREPSKGITATRTTLAVLPFHVLNRQEDIGFLGLAIPDAITARLARAGRLRVTPTNAVVHAQPDGRAIPETARALGVDYLLTGTIQLIADSTRVTVQLVSAADNGSVWAEHYDLPHANLLTLEDAISEKVAGALKVPVTSAERAQLTHRYTSNALAYESYLRGRAELLRYTQEGTLAAIKSFDAAARIDPRYPLAHAGLASASAQMHLRFAADDEVALWSARAQREASLALDLDPELAEVHEALAAVYGQTDFDWPRTISESRQTLALNPSLPLPHYYLARAFYHYGLLEMIESEVRAGLDIDPVNRLEAYRLRGTAALVSGRFQEALHWLGEARKLSAPEVTAWYYAQSLYYAGDRHGAESLLQGLRGSAQAGQRARATLASFLAADGVKPQAEVLIGQTLAIAYMDHHVAYSLGAAYAQLGQPGQAVAWLRKAADSGFPCYPWYAGDPLLQPIHADPAFGRLLSDLQNQLQLARTRYR
ncbi:MAG: hypothetical protein E6K32_09445 [Gammaproteobacteria bacterium]|nr:MAG: hypothetical protein E6K32_09445 [Gammaproteobacteria bacterium]